MTTKPFTLRRGLTWILAGATFLGVLATTGCAAMCPALRGSADAGETSGRASRGTGPDVDPWQDASKVRRETAPAGVVNVFGEFGGARRNGPVRQVGEAGFQQHTSVDEGEDSGVAVDPTGRWMVYASTRHSEHADIYVQRVDGTSVTQLTNDSADDAFPVFSPDGKKIAFCSTRSGTWQVHVMDADGRNVVQLTSGRTQCIHPSFAPDGKRVAYSSMGARSGQWELWTASLDSGEQKMIGYGLFPSWSPRKDVDRIAYQRPRQRGSRWFSLWTMDLVDGEGRRPTEVAVSPVAAIVTPTWSPDGRRLAFATVVEPAGEWSAKPRGQQDVWTIDADGTNRQRLTDGSGSNLMPFWAADGRVYFISDRDGHECVWSVKADGAGKTFTADTNEREAR
jgi:Tol biopolymer transport system component